MRKMIIANWKMNPATIQEAEEIMQRTLRVAKEFPSLDTVVCPPFIFLEEMTKLTRDTRVLLGAQDIAVEDSGASTGEVSGPMLKQLGVRLVIVGHSERRWKLGETDDIVSQKIQAALRNDLTPVVCVGERNQGDHWREELHAQAQTTFQNISPEDQSKCIIAYEPVWAISTNPNAQADTPAHAAEAVALLNESLKAAMYLYGGSVNSTNVGSYITAENISGVLVGGASLKEEFSEIITIIGHANS